METREPSPGSCSRSSTDPMGACVGEEGATITCRTVHLWSSMVADHFRSEGEFPLKGREVGEESVILEEDVQVDAVGRRITCGGLIQRFVSCRLPTCAALPLREL